MAFSIVYMAWHYATAGVHFLIFPVNGACSHLYFNECKVLNNRCSISQPILLQTLFNISWVVANDGNGMIDVYIHGCYSFNNAGSLANPISAWCRQRQKVIFIHSRWQIEKLFGYQLHAFSRHEIWGFPDSKVHGANMGPTWVLSAPCWSHEPWYQGYSGHSRIIPFYGGHT